MSSSDTLSLDLGEIYQKKELEKHIYDTPDTYVGGCDKIDDNFENGGSCVISSGESTHSSGSLLIFFLAIKA